MLKSADKEKVSSKEVQSMKERQEQEIRELKNKYEEKLQAQGLKLGNKYR